MSVLVFLRYFAFGFSPDLKGEYIEIDGQFVP